MPLKRALSAIFILLICAIILYIGFDSVVRNTSIYFEPKSVYSVIIDPGHGGIDGGAIGCNGIVEKDINLSISLYLRDIFMVNGFNVIMTREADVSLDNTNNKRIRKQKVSDMNNRLQIIKDNPNAIFISIHQNKFEQASSKGAQIFYGKKNEESKIIASILQDNFKNFLQPDNKRQIKQAEKNLYLLYNSEIPSVLVECGFLSNPDEAKLLSQSEYQQQVAFTIFSSITQYYNMNIT